MRRWPERKLAALVRCQECHCISEDARDRIAKLIDDDEEPDYESFVVLYFRIAQSGSSSGSRAAGLWTPTTSQLTGDDDARD